MSRGTKDLEELALELAREAAKEGRVHSDLTARLDEVIRVAYERGGENTAAELADAYVLYILDDDDMDSFRDALTERVPDDYQAAHPEAFPPSSEEN